MTRILSLDGLWDFTRLSRSILTRSSVPVRRPVTRKIPVPSNWYLAGEDFAGEALYETTFRAPELREGQAAFLRFKGADYFLRAELNGRPLGRHEGYFQTFDLPIPGGLGPKNRLKVWVRSPKENAKIWPHRKRLIKGIFNHHDARPGSWDPERGQDLNTGGLWNGVELVLVDRVLLKETFVTTKILPGGKAEVALKLVLLHFSKAEDHDLEAVIRGLGFPASHRVQKRVRLARGRNEVVLKKVLPKARLWWTWDQGKPDLYEARVRVRRASGGEGVEEGKVRFGIRELKVTPQWEFFLNGRRFFPRGTNIIPTQWLSEYRGDKPLRDVRMMKEANLNAVRVHAHVNRKEFYEACDEEGLFVWQDFALQWSYQPGPAFAKEACRQAKEMVRQFYNHASILVWCCHNEPSFNKDGLDPLLARAVREEDATRFVDVQSDFRYHPYPGWYLEDSALRDTPGTLGPDTRFYSEFGAQALPGLPALRKMFKPRDLWPPNWKEWAFRDFQYFQTFNVAKVPMGRSLKEFVANSQAHQARCIKEYIESFRAKKYGPMNGYFHFMFVDCWPSITWSVVDYFREPKEGYGALRQASQPLLPLWRAWITRYNRGDTYHWGSRLLEGVQLVNDLPRALRGVTLEARLSDPRGRTYARDRASCNVPADCIVKPFEPKLRYNHIQGFQVPARGAYGEWKIEMRVRDKRGKLLAYNDYAFQVVPRQGSPRAPKPPGRR